MARIKNALYAWLCLALSLAPIHAVAAPVVATPVYTTSERIVADETGKPIAAKPVFVVTDSGKAVSWSSITDNGPATPSALLTGGAAIVSAGSKYIDSSAIVILSDSTGIQPTSTTAWPYLLAQDFAAQDSRYAIVAKFWNDSTQDYDGWNFITANTERYVNMVASDGTARTRTMLQGDVAAFSNLDLRVDVAATDWTPASTAALVGQWGGAGAKSHRFLLRSDGKLQLEVTTDGSTTITATSTVAPSFTDGAREVVRVTRLASSGAVNFYYKLPTASTWTQLGTQVAATSGALASVTRDYELGGTGGQFTMPGKYFAIEYRADIGDSFKIVNPQPIESWYGNENVTPMAGSPTLYMWIGAKSGADAAYLTDSTRGPKLVPPIWVPTLGIGNDGHNESTAMTRTAYFTAMDGFKTLLQGQAPGSTLAFTTQNPRTDGVEESHRRHMNWLRAWGLRNGVPIFETYLAYLKSPNSIASNLQGDGLHPNAAGAALMEDAVAERVIY